MTRIELRRVARRLASVTLIILGVVTLLGPTFMATAEEHGYKMVAVAIILAVAVIAAGSGMFILAFHFWSDE